jgi:hypothetical protein
MVVNDGEEDALVGQIFPFHDHLHAKIAEKNRTEGSENLQNEIEIRHFLFSTA